MAQNKIVVKFKDNTIAKGKTSDFFPNKVLFHMEGLDGKIVELRVEDLKAVFFVRDYDGNKEHKDNYSDEIVAGGRKIQAVFADGEVIVGYTVAYSPDRQGFFMTPADLQGNNERIFVVKSATKKIEFV